MPPARPVLVLLFVAGVGCKPHPGTAAPGRSEVPDDIAEIEATLARNADDLQAAGIVVAQREVTEPEGAPMAESEPGTDDAAGGEEAEEATTPTPSTAPPANAPPEPEAAPAMDLEKRSRRSFGARRFERRRDREDDRCQRICDLAEATCALADRICDLAERHPDEVRYETACERADAQCEAAANACTACTD